MVVPAARRDEVLTATRAKPAEEAGGTLDSRTDQGVGQRGPAAPPFGRPAGSETFLTRNGPLPHARRQASHSTQKKEWAAS
ncbi:hypothetical protein GCM10010521_08310 [Streptomyces rameus]|uniref:Uncharacterized protein n=1 Tax=Streptomyces rameus TaxID=68261 RepID=A0ABP6MU29_9ACTN